MHPLSYGALGAIIPPVALLSCRSLDDGPAALLLLRRLREAAMRACAASGQPAAGIVRLVIDADLEVQVRAGGLHTTVAQRADPITGLDSLVALHGELVEVAVDRLPPSGVLRLLAVVDHDRVP
jgi:hypothetical protein